MPDQLWLVRAAFGVGLALAAVAGARRFAVHGGWLALALLAPVLLLQLTPGFAIHGFHGLFHAAIAYGIAAGGLPTTDPLMAGEPLRYAHGLHVLVAGLVRLGVDPARGFLLLHAVAVPATAWALFRIALALGLARKAAWLAAALALLGVDAFANGPLSVLQATLATGPPEWRHVPIQKFATAQANGVGILLVVLALLAAVRMLGGQGRLGAAVGLVAAVWALVAVYPLLWPVLVVALPLASALALAAQPDERAGPAWLGGAWAVAIAVSLPGVLALLGKSADASPRIELGATHLVRGLVVLAGMGVSVSGLLAAGHRSVRTQLEQSWAVWSVPLAVVVVGAGAFLLAHLPLHTEYKYLAVAGIGLAFPVAMGLDDLLGRRPALAWAALALLWLPIASWFAKESLALRGDPGAIAREGASLTPTDPGEAALTSWIRDHAPARAAFVDDTLHVPVFGQRSLYVALDPLGGADARARALAGWGMLPSVMLERTFGHEASAVHERRDDARALLAATPPPDDALLARVAAEAGGPVYVITRAARGPRWIASDPRFDAVHAAPAASVYELRR